MTPSDLLVAYATADLLSGGVVLALVACRELERTARPTRSQVDGP